MKKNGKGRVRVVVEFGSLDGSTVCRVRTVNADRDTSVRRSNAALGLLQTVGRALEERLTDRPFAVQFGFSIEPRRMTGRLGYEEGTCWIEYFRRPCCTAMVLETGMAIYRAVIGVCHKVETGKEN